MFISNVSSENVQPVRLLSHHVFGLSLRVIIYNKAECNGVFYSINVFHKNVNQC